VASEGEASIDESIFVASGWTAAVALRVRHRLQRRRRQAALFIADNVLTFYLLIGICQGLCFP
jgi:hypothetical protein